jgi:hypothetical protein
MKKSNFDFVSLVGHYFSIRDFNHSSGRFFNVLTVVIHDETLIRIAGLSFHTVPPHQQVPSSWISLMILFVISPSPKETRTWFKFTSLRISKPAFSRLAANNFAQVQHLSINSTMPSNREFFSEKIHNYFCTLFEGTIRQYI